MSFIKEFKDFAMRGNVVDLAVGVIIGAAFGKIVSSVVGDIAMPILGLLVGGISFTHLKITLREATGTLPAATLNYGQFIQNIFDFFIVALVIFSVVKGMNALRKKEEANPTTPPTTQELLLGEIRDLLKKRP